MANKVLTPDQKLREAVLAQGFEVLDMRDEGLTFDASGAPIGYQAYVIALSNSNQDQAELLGALIDQGFDPVDGHQLDGGQYQVNWWYTPEEPSVEDFKRVFEAPGNTRIEDVIEFFQIGESQYEDLYEMAFPTFIDRVKDLIEVLQEMDPEALVTISVGGSATDVGDIHSIAVVTTKDGRVVIVGDEE